MKTTIFIDESGTLPDTKDEVIVVAAVGASTPIQLNQLFKKVRKQLKKRSLPEIKFYTAGEKTKEIFFKNIIKENLGIFVLVVDKKGRKIPDTPEHFALLCWLLLTEVLNFYPNIKEIIFDRHFHRKQDLEAFNNFLKEFLGLNVIFRHVDSRLEKEVNVADMIAGATLSYIRGRNSRFYEIFKEEIISEIKINWPEVKRRLIQKKNSSEPV